MFHLRLKSVSTLFCLAAIACGCAEQKKSANVNPAVVPNDPGTVVVADPLEKPAPSEAQPALTAVTPETTKLEPVSSPAADEKPSNPAPENGKVTTAEKPQPRPEVKPFTEAVYLPNDLVGLLAVHPKQFFGSPIGKLLTELGFETESGEPAELLKRLNLKLNEIDRVTIVIDQSLVNTFAVQNGLPVANPAIGAGPAEKNRLKNSLKQIGLAFHNYHDVFQKFPRADGDGTGQHTGLSWRVHLLPFLDHAQLYNQFHFDEAWDSEHNISLIPQMPALFKSPGVDDNEKTAFHVFTGEKTMFTGEQGHGIRNVTDGTSNTILALLAPAATAEIWTKPGGLEVDLSAAKKILGEDLQEPLLVLIADGSVRTIPASIDETMLANLIQPGDGNIVDFGDNVPGSFGAPGQPPISIPPTIIALNRDVNPDEMATGLLGPSTKEMHEGQSFHQNQTLAIWFPDSKTVILGSQESVKKMISAGQTGTPSESPLISQLQLAADYSAVVDLESQAALIAPIIQMNPMLGMISNVKTLAAQFSANEKVGNSLLEINVTALDAGMANGLGAVATMGLNQGKLGVSQLPEPPNANASDKEMFNFIKQLVASATVTQQDDTIQLKVPTPKGFDRITTLLKPALLSARAAARDAQQRNIFKMIGLAFHNYESVYRAFPGAARAVADAPVGLSWRVHLLPFLDQAPLYNQFKLDEAWDSEHNKTMIEKMPTIFKSPGVDEVGKTSIHVFTGPGSLFADDKTPALGQITDGTSNTLLAVLAGPDTAEIWTKPGGLDFDPESPIKALGNLIGENFIALLADGSVRMVSKNIDAKVLRRLIQMNDGESVPGEF